MKNYAQVVESIEELSEEQQESLLDLVQHRLAERRRDELIKSVHQVRREFKAGKAHPTTPAELMRKILK